MHIKKILSPDPRPSKAHPEHRATRKKVEKEHSSGFEWASAAVLALAGITMLVNVEKDVEKCESRHEREEREERERRQGGKNKQKRDDGESEQRTGRERSRRGRIEDRRASRGCSGCSCDCDSDRDYGQERGGSSHRDRSYGCGGDGYEYGSRDHSRRGRKGYDDERR
ncbi:hypothetical protein B0T17DRAFT_104794 [Bombardia bombarda]|uniref:Uncharacterized protein n=1 Tax=Bombardia bombarda TaxID=252184 RepID=A0AA40CH28_9PEZI|nr:hypothetical protein B0T17DRAFT_104794 [Bombardia bombarda]